MADNIHYLAPRQADIGHFFRLGHTGYRILENLHAAGRLPIKRAVVDASHMDKQKDLINSLKAEGTELILDPKAAELSTPGGFTTTAGNLPWAHKNRHHHPSDFTKRNIIDYCEKIVEFAVAQSTRLIDGFNQAPESR